MLENIGKFTSYLVSLFIGLTLFGVFFPLIQTAVDNLGLDNITLFSTSYDFSWAGYIFILGLVLILVFASIKTIEKNK